MVSTLDGTHLHPERFSRRFTTQVLRARKALGEDQVPVIRLHDLRHTHATLPLADGVPVEVVSERLDRANATITLTVYQHVHPGMGREAADRFAVLRKGRPGNGVSNRCHEQVGFTSVKPARSSGMPVGGPSCSQIRRKRPEQHLASGCRIAHTAMGWGERRRA